MIRIIKINGKKAVYASDAENDFEAVRHILDWLENQLGFDEYAEEKKKNYLKSIEINHVIYDLTEGKNEMPNLR